MTRICRIAVLGDSLSDRGTLDKRKLLGFIPLSLLSGLDGKSPKGRFTNGYLWGDYVCSTIAEEFEISHVRQKLKLPHNSTTNADISDEFISNDSLRERNRTNFSLNNDRHILYKKQRFARFYCEGGLTSYDYSKIFTIDPSKEFPRLILSNLEKKRNELLAEDKRYAISKQEKAETLIIEWSGGNDFITINEKPTHKEADDAVNERIKNVEVLIQQGYRNFILFNLPDLGLTPRFQAKSKKERNNATECSDYFNTQLANRCIELNKKYKDLNIPINFSVFDVNTEFKKIYHNPEQYGLDSDKLKTPYTSSAEFEKNKNNPEYEKEKLSPSDGFMFWDDIHPTMDTHNILAAMFKSLYGTVFDFFPPQQRNKLCADDYDRCRKHSFFEETSKTNPMAKLPKEICIILQEMHKNANSMCRSSNQTRKEKGELLKQLLFELKTQDGNLEKIHGVLSAFTMDTEAMKIIKTHHHSIIDFFLGKKTTRSEDTLSNLEHTIKAHMEQTSPQMSL